MQDMQKLYLDCFNRVRFDHDPKFKCFSSKFYNIINFLLDAFSNFIESSKLDSYNCICSICLNDMRNKTHLDCCVHEFCYDCIKKWRLIKSTCPICRKFIRTIKKSVK